MSEPTITVEVAYALPNCQHVEVLQLARGVTAREALALSGLPTGFTTGLARKFTGRLAAELPGRFYSWLTARLCTAGFARRLATKTTAIGTLFAAGLTTRSFITG